MPGTFTCRHCGKTLPRNPRQKKQRYCSTQACQNARKRSHDKKVKGTVKYKLNQQRRNKRWREKAPAHAYQAAYRKRHPAYVKRNCMQQKLRNDRLRKKHAPLIVKTDALLLQPCNDGAYMAFKVKKQKIVKTDTLLLQMQMHQGMEAYFP